MFTNEHKTAEATTVYLLINLSCILSIQSVVQLGSSCLAMLLALQLNGRSLAQKQLVLSEPGYPLQS